MFILMEENYMLMSRRTLQTFPLLIVTCLHHCMHTERQCLDKIRFKRIYGEAQKPVLISGLMEKWHARELWRKPSLLDKYGAMKTMIGSSMRFTLLGGKCNDVHVFFPPRSLFAVVRIIAHSRACVLFNCHPPPKALIACWSGMAVLVA